MTPPWRSYLVGVGTQLVLVKAHDEDHARARYCKRIAEKGYPPPILGSSR